VFSYYPDVRQWKGKCDQGLTCSSNKELEEGENERKECRTRYGRRNSFLLLIFKSPCLLKSQSEPREMNSSRNSNNWVGLGAPLSICTVIVPKNPIERTRCYNDIWVLNIRQRNWQKIYGYFTTTRSVSAVEICVSK
jgi:hypothetical protein